MEREGKLDEILGSYLVGTNGAGNTLSLSNPKSRQSSHVGPILLSQVRAEDSGKVFVCWVNNSISTDTARVTLNVYGERKVSDLHLHTYIHTYIPFTYIKTFSLLYQHFTLPFPLYSLNVNSVVKGPHTHTHTLYS